MPNRRAGRRRAPCKRPRALLGTPTDVLHGQVRHGVFVAAIATPLDRNSLRIPCSGKDPATRAPLEAKMFRKAEWLVAAALVLPLAACVETMDSGYGYSQPSYGYGYGYGNGYSGGYYPSQAYYAPPVVYSQTRYV